MFLLYSKIIWEIVGLTLIFVFNYSIVILNLPFACKCRSTWSFSIIIKINYKYKYNLYFLVILQIRFRKKHLGQMFFRKLKRSNVLYGLLEGVKTFSYDCNLGSQKRERTLRQFDTMGNALHDMSWSTCEINPRCNGTSERVTSRTGSYKACPNEAVTSLKSKQVTYWHEGDMARHTVFVPSSGNRGCSRNRKFPFKGTPLCRFDAMGNVNITPP